MIRRSRGEVSRPVVGMEAHTTKRLARHLVRLWLVAFAWSLALFCCSSAVAFGSVSTSTI